MGIRVRTERIEDYHQIAEVVLSAFTVHDYLNEAMIFVDMLRHGPNFRPELSFVAEADGDIVGHALFYPDQIFIGGREHRAVTLAPLSVKPGYQGQGVGTLLLKQAHRYLEKRGYDLSLLCGSPKYYSRFGYLPNMFCTCVLRIARDDIPSLHSEVTDRWIEPSDTEHFVAMWEDWFHDVDLALFPGTSIVDWASHSESVGTATILIDGKVRGFLRYDRRQPGKLYSFLARDREATSCMIQYVNRKIGNEPLRHLELPLHPQSRAAKEWIAYPYVVEQEPKKRWMIKILNPENETVVAYCEQVAAGIREPGLVVWPSFYDIIHSSMIPKPRQIPRL